ncbi:MAG: phospho-sugar mutase [Rhodopirellula sp.]|nr:phospho-sugar mutase [Rhodopirellula sp.]
MPPLPNPPDTTSAVARVRQAARDKQLSEGAVTNLEMWLTEPRYREYLPQVLEHIDQGQWQKLDDAFWTVIPFGTGGRRGTMYPIGSNTINDRTIGESAQGLAEYVREHVTDRPLSCAIAYDTRHRSRHFAELCSEIMVANGYRVFFLDGYRSTPELSFAVRRQRCSCGIMVTASHNPPSDNAVKAYWSSGGQLLPPHDTEVIDRVMNVGDILRVPFEEALAKGQVVYCQEEVDRAFFEAVVAQSRPGPRDLKIIYSPLHGVGASAVMPALEAAGFKDVELFGPHAEPSGDFPNVPGHVSNPENPRVFDAIIDRARQIGADLVMATDPDCDRVGCAAPLTLEAGSAWGCLTGNQIGALLADYLLEAGSEAGTLTAEHYVVKTLVTTELIRKIAESRGVDVVGDLLVGFKWIGGVMDRRDPKKFILGAEESYGFLVGDHARDKDAAVASMLLAELAARAKVGGHSIHQKLDALFRQHGHHAEKTVSVTMPGSEGMQRMMAVMAKFREDPPGSLAGMKTARVRDYQNNVQRVPGGPPQPLEGPTGDLVMIDLQAEGNYVAVRPSGTEPKVKFYMFAFQPPERIADLGATKTEVAERLAAMEKDLRIFAGT